MSDAILIIGAGSLQVPGYLVARRLGVRSIAIDRNPNAPGMRLADVAYVVDTRDVPRILEVARLERVTGVTTLCTDAPVVSVAAVAAALGLSAISPEAAARATNKALMRDALAAAGVGIPGYRRVGSLADVRGAAEELGYPVILKPPASSGSRGIFKAARPEQLSEAYAHARSVAGDAGSVLVEEFVGGEEVSVETLSFGGRHEVISITDKRTTGDPYWVEVGHAEPSRLSPTVQEAIRTQAVAGLAALGVSNAAGHVEIKVDRHGPRVIEIGARLGGDFITTELVPRSSGVDMVEAIICIALGRGPCLRRRSPTGAAIRYLLPPAGVVEEVTGVEEARAMPGVVRLDLEVERGRLFDGVRSSLDRPGFVIAEGIDAEEAERRAVAAAERVTFRVKANG